MKLCVLVLIYGVRKGFEERERKSIVRTIFTLTQIGEKAQKKKKCRVYVGFIDLEVYDRVNGRKCKRSMRLSKS